MACGIAFFHGQACAAADWSGRFLVKWKVAGSGATLQTDEGLQGTKVLGRLDSIPWNILEAPAGLSLNQALAQIRSSPQVDYVEPDYPIYPHGVPNDPSFGLLWGLDRIGISNAWNVATGTTNVVVAILDSGLDRRHTDLSSNLWVNTKEIPNNNKDDDSDGVIDDVNGANATTMSADIVDETGHGTHVAGTIGAVGNNRNGIAGVNWRVSLLPVKIFTINGFGSTSAAVQAYDYLIKLKKRGVNIRVINNSWGGPFPSRALYDAICAAYAAGILSVCSAGNSAQNSDYQPEFPANFDCDGLISVAASNVYDEPASYSNFGASTVHLAAPGDSILSTYPGGGYFRASGTSMASPHVAGVAALLLAKSNTLSPNAIKALLLLTADVLPAWNGLVTSGGRLNAGRAMSRLLSGPIPILSTPMFQVSKERPHWTPVSRNQNGHMGNDSSFSPALSADGRFVAFLSRATNLVKAGTNGFLNVILHDHLSGSNVLASRPISGNSPNTNSEPPVITPDGRYVVYASRASNLMAGDNNNRSDIFLFDATTGKTELISKSKTGGFPDGDCRYPSISSDGNLVAFASDATTIVPLDTNARADIFLRNRRTQTTTRINPGLSGAQANQHSSGTALSADGRWVVFASLANNLVSGISLGSGWQLYERDLQTGNTVLITHNIAGGMGNASAGFFSLSADGKTVAFESDASDLVPNDRNGKQDIFTWNADTGSIERVSVHRSGAEAEADSSSPQLSANGRWLAFHTASAVLSEAARVPGEEVYLRDRDLHTTSVVQFNAIGRRGLADSVLPSLSADGRFLAMATTDWNLIPGDGNANFDIVVLDRGDTIPSLAGYATKAGVPSPNGSVAPQAIPRVESTISETGDSEFQVTLANHGSTNAQFRLTISSAKTGWSSQLVYEGEEITPQALQAGWTAPPLRPGEEITLKAILRSVDPSVGAPVSELTCSAFGESAQSASSHIRLVASRPPSPPTIRLLSKQFHGDLRLALEDSRSPVMSADGLFIAFVSTSGTLVTNDMNVSEDVFVIDRRADKLECVSKSPAGATAKGRSESPSISADGRFVAFISSAEDLTAGDTNNRTDVFLRDRQEGTLRIISLRTNGLASTADSGRCLISGNGEFVAFEGADDNLCPGDTNHTWDVFLWNRLTGSLECISRSTAGRTGNAESHLSSLSFDGNSVTFTSLASDLVAGDDNRTFDIFLWRASNSHVELISRDPQGKPGNEVSLRSSLSEDGRWILFTSLSTNLLASPLDTNSTTYLFDTQSNQLSQVTPPQQTGRQRGSYFGGALQPNGRHIIFQAEVTTGIPTKPYATGAFLYDLRTGTMEEVSRDSFGQPADHNTEPGPVSRDGRWMVLETRAPRLIGQTSGGEQHLVLLDRSAMQPDVAIKRTTNSPFRGDGILTSTGQSISVVTRPGATQRFIIQIRNRGTFADTFRIIDNLLLEEKDLIHYFTLPGSQDISGAVRNLEWVSRPIDPGSVLEVQVTIAAQVASLFDHELRFKIISTSDLNKPDSVQIRLLKDSDGDGLPDDWEMTYFGSITSTFPSDDPDGDGSNNLEEFLAGTTPTDPLSTLRILELGAPAEDGSRVLRWTSVEGRYYSIEQISHLGGEPSTTIVDSLWGNLGSMELRLPQNTDSPTSFYRLRADLP